MPENFPERASVERCLELVSSRVGKSDEAEKLRQENRILQNQNEALRKAVSNLTRQLNEAKKSTGSAAPAPASAKSGKVTIYQVRRNDTLSGIAKAHGVTLKELCRANNLNTNSELKIGQQLRIPEK